ncbi:S1 RNA-binding domain-containing protein [Ornithinibacillus sp. 4-3]|uniref:S1 RNA-binding domain-containing protein n=1 Tax=Ornithinibacillus sp. 4-3 TaxID=3231488 RepID=A0AB39HT13_9BACI
MDFVSLGTVQRLKVDRAIETGYVLKKEEAEILLHHNEITNTPEVGEVIEVFLYHDKNNRTVATMSIPTIQLGTYGWAEVVEVVPRLGVFVQIGIAKEMLVSIDDLPLFEKVWPAVGDQLFVTLSKDHIGRLLAIPATEKVMMERREIAPDELLNTTVNGRVYRTSREGTAIMTEEGYRGFIHHTERKKEPRLGELIEARVIQIKDDATLNLSLLPLKQERISDDAEQILQHIIDNDGVIPFSDKSDPEEIRGTFEMSKSAFKRALGSLLKADKIEQRDNQTFLKEN